MPPSRDHDSASSPPVWVGRTVVLMMGGVAAVLLVAVATAVITLAGALGGTQPARATAQTSLAAQRTAADRLWASNACTDVLAWKNEIHHDDSSLSLGFGPVARVQDAIAATRRMLGQLDRLGLPPAAQTSEGRAQTAQLQAALASRLRTLEGAASSVASGNLAAIGTLIADLSDDSSVGTQVVAGLRRVVSVDLGLSLVETRACRQLAGIPV
jgi:hypothetical protein